MKQEPENEIEVNENHMSGNYIKVSSLSFDM